MRKWITVFALAVTMFTTEAAAQNAQMPPSGAQTTDSAVRHFPYTRPAGSPLIPGIRKLFPELKPGDPVAPEMVLQLLKGEKGLPYQTRMQVGIGGALNGKRWKTGQKADQRVLDQVTNALGEGKFKLLDIQGKNCTSVVVNGTKGYKGDCDDTTMNRQETYALTDGTVVRTQYSPVQVGFDSKVIAIEGIELPEGTEDGGQEATLFITVWFSKWYDPVTRKEIDPEPCINLSAHVHSKPAPVAIAVPPPPPPPARAFVAPPPVVAVPLPAPTSRTVVVTALKFFFDRNGCPTTLPRNAEKIEVVGPNGERPNMVRTTVAFGGKNEKCTSTMAPALRLTFPNVELEEGAAGKYEITETKSISGWKPLVKERGVLIPEKGDWKAFYGQYQSTDNFGLSEPVLVNQKNPPCRFLKLPCLAWIPIGAAIVATPFLVPHHDPTPTPTPTPTSQCGVTVKCGGPGGSPASTGGYATTSSATASTSAASTTKSRSFALRFSF